MKTYRYIIVALCAVIVALPLSRPSHIFAAEGTTQDTQQTAVNTVKEAISNLVSAKDEKKQTETPVRIDTLKKAVLLAISEAKELRVKLIGLEDLSTEYETWATKKSEDMKGMIDTLETFKKDIAKLEEDETTTDEQIKGLGEKIKTWREITYLPLSTEIQDYFLIIEEYKTIETAESRSEKIGIDVTKLEKRKKNTVALKKLLTTADSEIDEAKKINDEAKALFEKTYLPKENEIIISTTTPVIEKDEVKTQPKSVRDLVKDSSNKVRNSYKIFIEMSNIVRKLLK